MSFRLLQACLVFLSLAPCSGLPAQTSGSPDTSSQPYRLQTGTRLVLTDVTVLDKSGNPVHGLGRSAFQVFDNGRLQTIASFDEHKGDPLPDSSETPSRAHPFNNNYLAAPPAVSNVLLLDTTSIDITDQMDMRLRLEKLVRHLSPWQSLAIYSRFGEYLIDQQDFTSDHDLLLAAINRALPRLRDPNVRNVTDMSTLQQLLDQLHYLAGRKNVLWFSGGPKFALRADASSLPPSVDLRPLYDELDVERIALYPIDARGLTGTEMLASPWQHIMMEEMAAATGGQAAWDQNELDLVASRVSAPTRVSTPSPMLLTIYVSITSGTR